MLVVIGALLALYVAYALGTGRVIAKAGVRMREVGRRESPGYYWVVIAIYSALALALFTVF